MSDKNLALFHMGQIGLELENLFLNLIDLEDLKKKKKNQKQEAFRSRALAAYALFILADVSPKTAAEAVVDGYNDNGIDAFLFNKAQNTLYLVQAKYIRSGSGSPKSNDMKSFKDGILDFLNFKNKRDRFNYKFEFREEEIETATRSMGLKIKVVIAYTGSKLSAHSRNTLNDLIQHLNDGQEIAVVEDFNLDVIRSAILKRHSPQKINVDFELYDWGRIDEPHQAFYGRIYAEDIVHWWLQHKSQLFDKNIRDFIGNSTANEDIINTIETEPEMFWYFNNGITALCDTITKAGARPDRTDGQFSVKGISIVNGAQTIGCIGYLYQNGSPEVREKIKYITIQIKLIALSSIDSNLDSKVTRATNTQNRVESRDFIALDSEQERLGKEFRVIGKSYHYKRTAETLPRDNNNYELEEATVALACSSRDVKLTILAKQEISRLWDDPSKKPYIALFNSSVNSSNLVRRIEVKRKVEEIIKDKAAYDIPKTLYSLLNYGNLFILYLIFCQSDSALFEEKTSKRNFESYLDSTISEMTDKTIAYVDQYMKDNYNPEETIWNLKVWNLFRSPNNLNKIKDLCLSNTQ